MSAASARVDPPPLHQPSREAMTGLDARLITRQYPYRSRRRNIFLGVANPANNLEKGR